MNLEIDIKEVLRYMGTSLEDKDTVNTAKIGIEKLKSIINPKYTYTKLPKSILNLTGSDIDSHLKDCEEVYILAATLGSSIDREIRLLQYKSMLLALALDSAATDAIEKLCDLGELEIIQKEIKLENYITGRYSPGYGDFPLNIQPSLIQFTEASKKIGLSLNENNILIPKKSVTALIGVSNEPVQGKQRGCNNCNLAYKCQLRKNGGCKNVKKPY